MNAARRRSVGFLRGCWRRLAALLAVMVAAALPWTGSAALAEAADEPVLRLAQANSDIKGAFVFRAVTWERVPGTARDISIGADGSVFKTGFDGSVWKWNNDRRNWTRFSGRLNRIAVDPQGRPWGLDENNGIFRYDGKAWIPMPGQARDIAIGVGGEVFVISWRNTPFSWNAKEKKWHLLQGKGTRIAVEPKGFPWMVGELGQIWRHDGSNWISIPGTARDIGIGPNGTVMITGTDGSPRRWNQDKQGWERMRGLGEHISVGPGGNPWMVDEKGVIFASKFFKEDAGEKLTPLGRTTPATVTSRDAIKFVKVKGAATDIGIGMDGSVFIVSTDSEVERWSNRRRFFRSFRGDLSRISVDPAGNPWGINQDGEVFRHSNKRWTYVKSVTNAVDLGVGADGSVFVTTSTNQIFKWDPSTDKLIRFSGRGKWIDVGRRGDPWVINSNNRIFHFEKGKFVKMPRQGKDIGVGPDDSVFMISTANRLFRWNSRKKDWDKIRGVPAGRLVALDVGPAGRPWFANSKQEVYSSGFFDRDESKDVDIARTTVTATTVIPSKPRTITFTKSTKWKSVPLLSPVVTSGSLVYDISVGANGDVFAVALDAATTYAFKYNATTNSWAAHTDVGTALERVDVDPDGSPWFVDTDTFIGRFKNSTFVGIEKASLDVGVGADGSVFIVDSAGAIYQWNDAKTRFDLFDSKFSGVGRNIDVDPNGRPWVVNNVFEVYQYDGDEWIKRSGVKVQDISIGANGSVFVAGVDQKPYKWNATSKIWDKVTRTADRVAVAPDGKLWIANTSDGKIFFAK